MYRDEGIVCSERRGNGENYLRQPKPDLPSSKFRFSALLTNSGPCDLGEAGYLKVCNSEEVSHACECETIALTRARSALVWA